ncbi:MAG: hypothetical protein ACLUEU_01240 [Oscillospiraceae bacterium]
MNGEATSVSNNKATQYGGVFVSDQATFTVSGKPTVTGNTKIGADSAVSNCSVSGWVRYITIADYGLHGNANSIGVTKLPESSAAEIVIAEGVNEDYSDKFFSDDQKREVKYENKQLVLKNKETSRHAHPQLDIQGRQSNHHRHLQRHGVCDFNHKGGSATITGA